MAKAKARIDLRAISPRVACDKPYELELVHHATGEPLDAFISVTGQEGSAFREHTRAKTNETLKRRFENERRNKKEEAPTIEQIEKEAIELLIVCTTGWRNILLDGEELEFNEANARKLYAEDWIRKQVDVAIGNLGNFMPS